LAQAPGLPPKPEEVERCSAAELSQTQFARMFGFSVDTVQQYEKGRRVPSGPASTFLRVIAAEPEAVIRALDPHRARRRKRSDAGMTPLPGYTKSSSGNTLFAFSSQPGTRSDPALLLQFVRELHGIARFPPHAVLARQAAADLTHNFRMSAPKVSALWKLSASLASNMISGCRLPSPAWKMMATCRPQASDICRLCGAASGRREVGMTPSMQR
jgi:hypothetical protein